MDPQSTFALIAKLSLALAGFGGVAAAFGGRDRSYAPVEMTRLRILFSRAFLALSTSLFAIGLLFAPTTEMACRWASVTGMLSETPTSAYFLRLVYQHTANRDTTPGLAWLLLLVGRDDCDPTAVRHKLRMGGQFDTPGVRTLHAAPLRTMGLHAAADSPQLAPFGPVQSDSHRRPTRPRS